MKTKFFHSLQFRFSLLIFFASIPIVLITYLDITYDSARELENLSNNTKQIVDFAATNETRIFDGTRQLLITQSNTIDQIISDKKKLAEYLRKLKLKFSRYQNFEVINIDGERIADASQNTIKKNFSKHEFFTESLKRKKFLVGPYESGNDTSNEIIVAVLPVLNNFHEVEYIITASLKESWFYKVEKELINNFPQNTIFIRADDEGYILNSFLSNSEIKIDRLMNSPKFKNIFQNSGIKNGSFELTVGNGMEYIFVFSSSSQESFFSRYYIIVGLEKNQFLYSLHEVVIKNLSIYFLVFISMLLFSSYLIKRYILNHVDKLIASTNKVALGNYNIRTGVDYKIGELGELAASFDNLFEKLENQISARNEVEKSLRFNEKRYREILENIKLIAIILDENANITFANDHLLNLTGWRSEEIINKNWYDLFLPDDIKEESKSIFISTLKTGNYTAHKINYIITRSGEERCIAWNNTIIKDLEDNIVGSTSIGEDITERKKVEEQLRVTEERFKTVINNIPITLFATDNNAIYIFYEGTGAKEVGINTGEIIGKSAYDLWGTFPFKELSRGTLNGSVLINRVLNGETFRAISEFNNIYFENYFAPSFDKDGNITGLVGVALNITERINIENDKERLFQEVRKSKRILQNLTHRIFKVQESEKRNLARELHDEIGQILTAIKINIQNLEYHLQKDKNNFLIQESISFIEEAIEKIRNISLTLRPSMLDHLGLIPSLRWFIKSLKSRNNINILFNTNVEGIVVNPEMEITLYRITQEALTNIIRHSKARNVKVEFNLVDSTINLEIKDDGKGFNVNEVYENAIRGKSLGVLSMKERTELLKGRFGITSSKEGTEISASFPLDFN